MRRSRAALTAFLEIETSGGIVLLGATFVAMLWANLLPGYETFWHGQRSLGPVTTDLRHAINDGLMTVFFLVVGLEIKREVVRGELRDRRVASLPVLAAVGGMVGPALIYLALNGTAGPGSRGWAIPMATDIAFVIGALSLFGSRAPAGLKLFVLTLAIADDIGAIVIIAIFYSEGLDLRGAFAAVMAVIVIVSLRASGVHRALAYLPAAVLLWYATLRTGIHPTLAGVALGLLTPAGEVRGREVLEELEARLHPTSSHVVVPLFALANAGVVLSGEAIAGLGASTVFWGISAGLVGGKTIGIFATSRLAAALRLGRRPAETTWPHILAGAGLSGIGFTVALFIAGLAFSDPVITDQAKLGVLAGSLASAIVGSAVLLKVRTDGRQVSEAPDA